MLVSTHRDYFTVVNTYHRAPPDKRAQMLSGYVHMMSLSHPDELTRRLVAEFYAKEVLRMGKTA